MVSKCTETPATSIHGRKTCSVLANKFVKAALLHMHVHKSRSALE